jgi:hypothetical protein
MNQRFRELMSASDAYNELGNECIKSAQDCMHNEQFHRVEGLLAAALENYKKSMEKLREAMQEARSAKI